MASGQDAHRGERPPRTARDASRGGARCPGRTSSHPGGTGVKKSGGGAGRDPSYKMGEGIVFSTVFFWRLRPEIGSNCHPVGSSSKTPSDALQTFSMETGQAGGESAAECGSGGRFSAGGRFYQVKSAIEHNGRYAQWFLCTARLYFGRGLVAVALKKAATKAGLSIIRLLVTQAQSNLGMILIYKIFFIKSIFNELVSCL